MRSRDSILDWIIVGGGIHGTYLTNFLIKNRVVNRSDIRVIDPHDEPMKEWKTVTGNVGMQYLRSPKVHHIDLEPFSLKYFAQCTECKNKKFTAPNDRPTLELFNRHADSVIRKNGLAQVRIRDYVVRVEPRGDGMMVYTGKDCYRTRNLVLAIGTNSSMQWPDWAREAKKEGGAVCHVFESGYCRQTLPEEGKIIVVGGGMSAVQTALSLVSEKRHVQLLSPHTLRMNHYDSDPGWMGPKYLNRFRKISSYKKRRSLIDLARNNGSITPDLKRRLMTEKKKGHCNVLTDTITACSVLTENLMLATVSHGNKIAANAIILATGYTQKRPGGLFVDDIISRCNLKCSTCGYPVTDASLQWKERLFVSGALAELEIGPASRNIIGARMAAEKMAGILI